MSHSLDGNTDLSASPSLNSSASTAEWICSKGTSANGMMHSTLWAAVSLHQASTSLTTCTHQGHKGYHFQKHLRSTLRSIPWSIFLREGYDAWKFSFLGSKQCLSYFALLHKRGQNENNRSWPVKETGLLHLLGSKTLMVPGHSKACFYSSGEDYHLWMVPASIHCQSRNLGHYPRLCPFSQH